MTNCDLYKKIDFINRAKHRIEVQAPTESSGDMGDYTSTFSTIATVNAIITPSRQIEKVKYAKINSEVTHDIIVRYQSIFSNPLVSAKYKIVWGQRIMYVVEAININEDKKFVKIKAYEVLS